MAIPTNIFGANIFILNILTQKFPNLQHVSTQTMMNAECIEMEWKHYYFAHRKDNYCTCTVHIVKSVPRVLTTVAQWCRGHRQRASSPRSPFALLLHLPPTAKDRPTSAGVRPVPGVRKQVLHHDCLTRKHKETMTSTLALTLYIYISISVSEHKQRWNLPQIGKSHYLMKLHLPITFKRPRPPELLK